MNFDLTGLFQRQSNIANTQGYSAMQPVSANAAGNGNLNLSVGQIVSGQVIAVDGDVVQVEVAPGTVLQAKVEDGLALLKGMSVSFEVSGMSDKQIGTCINSVLSQILSPPLSSQTQRYGRLSCRQSFSEAALPPWHPDAPWDVA